MPRPLRVFLCHASQDKPAVWKLHRYLKQHGIKPWLDREDLLPGEDWEVEIPKALFASDVILVCISKNSVNKEGFVQKEISFALDKALEKPEGTIFIIPVKLEECDIPKRLSRYQWVDLSRPDGRKRLLMGLNKRVNELGSEVEQIPLDDTRLRTNASKTSKAGKPTAESSDRDNLSLKPEIKKLDEQIASAPAKEEVREAQKKEIPAKPFTKLLTPSSLSPKGISDSQGVGGTLRSEAVTKRERKPVRLFNTRFLAISGIIVLALVGSGFGLNYLINNLPFAPMTTSGPPTFTGVPFTPTPQPTEVPPNLPAVGSTWRQTIDGMVLVFVPADEFTMGSETGESDEKPVHEIYLDAFWMDRTEVTNSQYGDCVDAGTCKPPSNTSSSTRSSYYGNPEFDDYPVIYVDWNMAKTYCEWAGRRLPTEAEWEKAARGTNARIYPWGSDAPNSDLLNYNSNVGDTTEVGKYPANSSIFGALDMAGNVSEWVNDWYGDSYYENSPSSNPLGPDSGQYRVLRGGSWYNVGYVVRSASRSEVDPSNSYDFGVGFRCVRGVPRRGSSQFLPYLQSDLRDFQNLGGLFILR